MSRPISYCSVDGCGRRCHGGGLCDAHYRRKKRGEPLDNVSLLCLDPATLVFPEPQLPPREQLVIWAAGFFDGEGCISCSTNGLGYHRLSISVVQTMREPLELLESMFRGSVGRKVVNRERDKPAWTWRTTGRVAVRALAEMRPYLRVKHKQADLALGMYAHRTDGLKLALSPEDKQMRADIAKQISMLNRAGSPIYGI